MEPPRKREDPGQVNDDEQSLGGEYYLRTFAVKSEMNVHILDKESTFPEPNDNTLTAFTWTFGIKVPF